MNMITGSTAALTPCAGRCSTVFGDSVCRGCRRFSHEVIDWNRYTAAQQQFIWLRLDQQLDQIILPIVALQDAAQFKQFLQSRQMRLPATASLGRQIYEVLRLVQRMPDRLTDSGLLLQPEAIDGVWQEVERRLYALAVASFECAWLRAATYRQ